ncbi:KLTH0F16060p [Lachancea thermotolerans CBS 6340]|uniref:KLTH0F16060p n=1 Tax=Lachancea thermotolerans (strain ATCC 56472 / CBS 6340 / NRRL Y-8284) TaxID=559295 RepID=C5DJF8_LACTC|nr:KLTH0F16060p [Lachancea thermotolerans CBS 6340]CAR24447.1 KLTH0F16060p [Lachancea thermotolerans CBS 6340]
MTTVLKKCTATAKLNTGAQIPLLGLGTWRSTKENGYNATLAAIKAGYRHIDIAAVCMNEQVVGRAIRDSGVPREELFVTTKLWCTQHRDPKTALSQSLKRLGLDYVDLYMMHWPVAFRSEQVKHTNYMLIPKRKDGQPDVDEGWDYVKTWELMQELPATGKTNALGVANFSVSQLKKLIDSPGNKIVPAASQLETHPFLPQNKMLSFCKKNNILMEAYSPLGSEGAPLLDEPVVREISKKLHVEPAQLLVSWGLQRGHAVLVKSKTPSRIEANLHTFDIPEGDLRRINELAQERGTKRIHNPTWFSFEE